MLVIGVSGTKRSGKNTFAEYVKQHLEEQGKSVKVGSWAELLKKSAYESLGFASNLENSIYELWADAFKQGHKIEIINSIGETIHSISGREFLQRYGTEGHREVFGDNFWIDQLWEANDFSGLDVFIIADCRYDNEAENVLNKNGVIIKIDNPHTEKNRDSHASEQGISEHLITYNIANDSDLEGFKKKSIELIEEIYG
jgi:hypothetical protein